MKEKIKNFFKSKMLIFAIGIFIGGATGVCAVTYFPSDQVTYNNSSSKLQSTNVQGALDELYGKCKACSSTGSSSSGGNIYVLGNGGSVFKYNGSYFQYIGDIGDRGAGIAVSGGNIYVLGDSGSVFKYNGSYFQPIGDIGDRGVGIAVSGGNIYVLDDDGSVFKYNGSYFQPLSDISSTGAGIAVG